MLVLIDSLPIMCYHLPMGIFKRRSKETRPDTAEVGELLGNLTLQKTEASVSPALAHAETIAGQEPRVGSVALSGVMRAEGEPSAVKANQERVQEIRQQIDAAQLAFLQDALARGMPEDEIAAAAKAAVSSGALPRIVRGLSFRGSGYGLHVLHGKEVPGAMLNVSLLRTPAGDIHDISITKALGASIPATPDPGDPNGLYQEAYFFSSTRTTPEEWARGAAGLSTAFESYSHTTA